MRNLDRKWEAVISDREFASTVLDADGEALAFALTPTQANLIAAAPELLAACKAYLNFAKDTVVSPVAPELKPIRDAIRAAVSKAETGD